MKHLTLVLGTRPEIIKLAPLLRNLEQQKIPYQLIHTNQHYSPELDSIFFQELQLPPPTYNLNIGSGSQAEQTARMLTGIEQILSKKKTDWVIVQGDTNSVLAGALVAAKLNIPVAHVEAGLRSYDRAMPEEINRIITDHIASALFPPTEACAAILQQEGIEPKHIQVVGNTVVDSVLQNQSLTTTKRLTSFDLQPKSYYLLTLHRPANVDTKKDLEEIFSLLDMVSQETTTPFFFPIHPRTRSTIERLKVAVPKSIQLHPPVGYVDFLTLQLFAKAIFTDSGGIQEEACILQVPCFTLRDTTERPETITVGANLLVNRDLKKVRAGFKHFSQTKEWQNPFGDGTASQQIIDYLMHH